MRSSTAAANGPRSRLGNGITYKFLVKFMSLKSQLMGGGATLLCIAGILLFLADDKPGTVPEADRLLYSPRPAVSEAPQVVQEPAAELQPLPEPAAEQPAPVEEPIELPERFTSYGDLVRSLESMGGCKVAGGPVGELIEAWTEKWRQNTEDFAVSFNSMSPTDAYQTYSEDTLQALARDNDPRAQVLLGHRAMAEKRNDEAKQAYYRAAMLGSVDAPHFMIWLLNDEKRNAQNENNAGRMVELTTEMVGWHRLLEKRTGVMYHPPSEKTAWTHVEPDERILQQAEALGQQLYQTMSAERRELGLGRFEDLPEEFELDEILEHIDCTPGQ